PNLEAGHYEVAAMKNGFQKSSVRVNVTPRNNSQIDLPLESASQLTDREKALLDRLERLESRLAAIETAAPTPQPAPILVASTTGIAAPPARASEPSPFPSPAPAPAPQPAAGSQQPRVPEALEAPETTPGVDNVTPFAYGNFTWLNGNPRNKTPVFDTKFF